MDAFTTSLARSPELFPQAWDPIADIVRLIRLRETDYRSASFLDDRILNPQTAGRTVAWHQLQAAVAEAGLKENCSFIFHTGHVGSTLLSRLLGGHPQVFALREPAILRALAQDQIKSGNEPVPDERLGTFLKLWSRTFRAEQRVCVKATSFASEIAGSILARPSVPRALFMFVPAETYLATILGAEHSPQEARSLAENRLKRLHRRIGAERWTLSSLSEGEMIAMSWASEMSALAAAAERSGDRVLWLNFEDFLTEPAISLAAAFCHLGIRAVPQDVAAILAGPYMRRYSKAPEYAYDAQLRREVLDRARRGHRVEISRGLAWLENASNELPMLKHAGSTVR
ncbi:MAG: hypothetical protein JOY77_09990 [Alphaproteobacteria bacterium]|nr:hypothetical protein [Alphaproteobacteria bacterium]MBV9063239.1 hypothetical protein [Alphaproteobacteria bacterium]